MVKHRKQGRLEDFEAKRTRLYDIRFDDGSIIINVEEGCLTRRSPKQRDKRLTESDRISQNWVRVGDVVLCEKGLGIIRFVGYLPGSKSVWMGMELKDGENFKTGSKNKVNPPDLKKLYFLGTPEGFSEETVVERDVLQCHNGFYRGKWYYDCPRGMGYWLRDKDIRKVYAPEEVLMQLGWLNLRIEEMKIDRGRKKNMSPKRVRKKPITAKPSQREREKKKEKVGYKKKPQKPRNYGTLSINKPHSRNKSALELSYKKNARNRMELVSNFANEDQTFLKLFKKELDGKPART